MKSTDVYVNLKQIRKMIRKETSFSRVSNEAILKMVQELTKDTLDFASKYYNDDAVYIHPSKKEIIIGQIIPKLSHLYTSTRYYIKNKEDGFEELNKIYVEIENAFNSYASFGSLYMFRHCDKDKTRKKHLSGATYDGIPSAQVRAQALRVANEILDEIKMSPKKVRVVIKSSEADRTRIFGDIVLRTILQGNHFTNDKVTIEQVSTDLRLRFDEWRNHALDNKKTPEEIAKHSKMAIDEVKPLIIEKGDSYPFFQWYHKTNELANTKYQPDPQTIINHVSSFVDEYKQKINHSTNEYVVVLAFTHSWIIDAFLMPHFEDTYQRVNEIIKTAEFFKVECGEINYLGKWLKH